MTPYNKKLLQRSVEALHHDSSTNLWAGIKAGLEVFEHAPQRDNVQGMYILTDGQPNHMCPAKGYAAKLKPLLAKLGMLRDQVPSIHTFGFGYQIRSGLLQTIAEIGLGSYAFIPDAGMIGTIFVHAVANHMSTYATQAVLTITSSGAGKLQCPSVFNSSIENAEGLVLRLGNLQYGQSRDIVISQPRLMRGQVQAVLHYRDNNGEQHEVQIQNEPTTHPDHQLHSLRSDLCEWLSSLFPKLPNGEHSAMKNDYSTGGTEVRLRTLTNRMQKSINVDGVSALFQDLVGEHHTGQIYQALQPDAWNKWGQHFLPSLLHAHARQVCNSFKDPGPLEYGKNSSLFNHCRDELDVAFENLPAPVPSRAHVTKGKLVKNLNMHRFHNVNNGCFDGQYLIRLSDDRQIPVAELRPRMRVWTPVGPQMVQAIVKNQAPRPGQWKGSLVRVGDVWLTPWHPIMREGQWVFPSDIAEQKRLCQSDVYSVLLEMHTDPNAHAVEVGGEVCVTLGHGITSGTSLDARVHAFFGDYWSIQCALNCLPVDAVGRYVAESLKRHPASGLVCGWNAAQEVPISHKASGIRFDHMAVSRLLTVCG